MKFVGKTLEYTIPNPSMAQLPKFIQASNPNYAVGPNRLTPLGFKAYMKVMTCVDLFLSANYYPAFKDLDEQIPQSLQMELGITGVVDKEKKQWFYGYKDKLKRNDEGVLDNHSVLKRQKIRQEGQDADSSMRVDEAMVELDEGDYGAMTFSDPAASVIYAKPSGRPSDMNYGGPGTCPALPGLVFPYFKGMTRPDFHTIRETLINHFFRLFGDDFESCKANISGFKRGLNNLGNTEAGMELSHVMKGIQLALSTQTRLYLIFDPHYSGFVLLGAHFSVWDGSMWIDPVSPEAVKEQLDRLDTHRNAVIEICQMLSRVDMKGSSNLKVDVLPDTIQHASDLLREMNLRDFTDYDDSAEFDKSLQALIWKTPYLQIGPDTLISLLIAVETGTMPAYKEEAIYIPSCRAPVSDPLFLCLARFGPDAPSLWHTRGEIISVLPEASRKGKEKEAVELPAVPKEFIIIPKPLLTAYSDWLRILKEQAVSFNFKERAREYRAHVIRDDGMRKRLWEGLQECMSSWSKRHVGVPSQKRKRLDASLDITAEDVLDLF
jgi:hypothetical protein